MLEMVFTMQTVPSCQTYIMKTSWPIKKYAMKMGGIGHIDPCILELDTNWRCGQLHTQAVTSGNNWIRGWVDLRTGLDDMEWRKILPLPGLKLRLPVGCPACSQLL
jgi:hypothetical protein